MPDERFERANTMLERTYSDKDGDPVDTIYVLITYPANPVLGELTITSNDGRLSTPAGVVHVLHKIVNLMTTQSPINEGGQTDGGQPTH